MVSTPRECVQDLTQGHVGVRYITLDPIICLGIQKYFETMNEKFNHLILHLNANKQTLPIELLASNLFRTYSKRGILV